MLHQTARSLPLTTLQCAFHAMRAMLSIRRSLARDGFTFGCLELSGHGAAVRPPLRTARRAFAASCRRQGDYASTIPNLGVKADATVLVQGTGKAVSCDHLVALLVMRLTGVSRGQSGYHNRIALDFGTRIEAFVAPGKGGSTFLDKPVYGNIRKVRACLPSLCPF